MHQNHILRCNLCPSAACPNDPTINICNNGTCSSTTYFSQRSISCSCFNGFTGTYCDLPVTSKTCNTYGTCLNGGKCLLNSLNQPFCSCPPGFYGPFCEIANACYNFPCLNGGQCQLSSNNQKGYFCVCPSSYSGLNCQTCKFKTLFSNRLQNFTLIFQASDNFIIKFN